MIFYITLLLILSIAPMIWLNYVFTKNDKILINMPFTGLEFGKIILKELGLNDVKIEKSLSMDHYDLSEKKVKVSENRLSRKSLTAISLQYQLSATKLAMQCNIMKNINHLNKGQALLRIQHGSHS